MRPDGGRLAMFLRAVRRFWSVVNRCRPEVILVNDRLSLRVASICCCLSWGARVIPIVHGFGCSHIRRNDSRNAFGRMLERQMRRFYRSRKLIICVSYCMRTLYLKSRFATPLQRVVVVHNGIESGFDRQVHNGELVRLRWTIASSTTVLLTLARLAPIKGQDVVIRALPRVIQEHPDVVYICAGSGEYEGTLVALAVEHGVARNVIFPGHITNDTSKYAYYDACDLFVMPSRFEPFGLSFLEAWHAGKPVLGGDRGGPVEIIENGVDGMTVDPDDVVAVANSILNLIRDPARLEEMGRRGMIKARRKFSRSSMADNLVSVLKDPWVASDE